MLRDFSKTNSVAHVKHQEQLQALQETSSQGKITYVDASGVIMKHIMMLEPAKLGSLCTDDVGNLPAARSLIPLMPGCSHIVQYRQVAMLETHIDTGCINSFVFADGMSKMHACIGSIKASCFPAFRHVNQFEIGFPVMTILYANQATQALRA